MSDEFEVALESALSRGADYDQALADLRATVADFSAVVSGKSGGHVILSVDAEGAHLVASPGLRTVVRAVAEMNRQARPHRIGDDKEDKELRLQVIAKGHGKAVKVLCEVVPHPQWGYPMTIVGPAKGETTLAHSAEDLRAAFVEQIASNGIVARKLIGLGTQSQSIPTVNDEVE